MSTKGLEPALVWVVWMSRWGDPTASPAYCEAVYGSGPDDAEGHGVHAQSGAVCFAEPIELSDEELVALYGYELIDPTLNVRRES